MADFLFSDILTYTGVVVRMEQDKIWSNVSGINGAMLQLELDILFSD